MISKITRTMVFAVIFGLSMDRALAVAMRGCSSPEANPSFRASPIMFFRTEAIVPADLSSAPTRLLGSHFPGVIAFSQLEGDDETKVLKIKSLLALPKAQSLRWTEAEQAVVAVVRRRRKLIVVDLAQSLGLSSPAFNNRLNSILLRLAAYETAVQRFIKADIRTWPLAMLLDRRSENNFIRHHLVSVSDVIGPQSPLQDRKVRNSVGVGALTVLTVALQAYPDLDLPAEIRTLVTSEAKEPIQRHPPVQLDEDHIQTRIKVEAIIDYLRQHGTSAAALYQQRVLRFRNLMTRLEQFDSAVNRSESTKNDAERLAALTEAFTRGPFELENFQTWPVMLLVARETERELASWKIQIVADLNEPESTFNIMRHERRLSRPMQHVLATILKFDRKELPVMPLPAPRPRNKAPGSAITLNGSSLTSKIEQRIDQAIADDFSDGQATLLNTKDLGLNDSEEALIQGVKVYRLPRLTAFDHVLMAHAGHGGAAIFHGERQVYLSPKMADYVRRLSSKGKKQFWRHEIQGHLDHPEWNESVVATHFPIQRVMEEVYLMRLGERVEQFRQRANLTQLELASAIQEYQSTIFGIENGEHSAHLRTFFKLAHFFKVPIEGLLDVDEELPPASLESIVPPTYPQIATRLENIMELQGHSQRDVAMRIGIKQPTISSLITRLATNDPHKDIQVGGLYLMSWALMSRMKHVLNVRDESLAQALERARSQLVSRMPETPLAEAGETYKSSFGERLKYLRTWYRPAQDRLTQSELATKLNVSQVWLSAIENGRSWPTISLLILLVPLLNIPLEVLADVSIDLTTYYQAEPVTSLDLPALVIDFAAFISSQEIPNNILAKFLNMTTAGVRQNRKDLSLGKDISMRILYSYVWATKTTMYQAFRYRRDA